MPDHQIVTGSDPFDDLSKSLKAHSSKSQILDECSSQDPELLLTQNQAEQFLASRRSIRTFRKKPVEHETLLKLLEIACQAPSAKKENPGTDLWLRMPPK